MSEQVLVAIIQLMGSIVGTEGVSAEAKATATDTLEKALRIINANITKVSAREVSNIVM